MCFFFLDIQKVFENYGKSYQMIPSVYLYLFSYFGFTKKIILKILLLTKFSLEWAEFVK